MCGLFLSLGQESLGVALAPELAACTLPVLLWLGSGQESIGEGGSVEEQCWGQDAAGGGAKMLCVPVVVYGRGPTALGLKQPV